MSAPEPRRGRVSAEAEQGSASRCIVAKTPAAGTRKAAKPTPPREPAEAIREEADQVIDASLHADAASLCVAHPLAYAVALVPYLQAAAHVQLIAHYLLEVERGHITRLIIEAPPRHTKTLLTSTIFPAWYLGRHPNREVILATYGQERANDLGRALRDMISHETHRALFPLSTIRKDQGATKSFGLDAGGQAFAVGIGGPTTGRGAHLFIVDDPIKDRLEADSPRMRQRAVDWFSSVASTRLYPNGAIVLMACMTGDTPVLMADGSEKPLAEIRPGDQVATYDEGELSSSKVMNWTSSGHDQVFKIVTDGGLSVRANERHPFLVLEEGELKWIRVKDLRPGHALVRVNGESGRARPASARAASSPCLLVDSVGPTTTKSAGPTEFGHLHQTQHPSELRESSTGTGSLSTSTAELRRGRAACVQSAGSLPAKTSVRIGAESSALTTATTQARSEGCSATTAICLLDTLKPPLSRWQQRSTSDFTTDLIASIEAMGVEEVFDVQIEGTENFIANGLVSHNTRWHEEDLSGSCLQNMADQGWVRLRLPAIAEDADDPLGRAPGEALWPERFSTDVLARMRGIMLPRDWAALYQQRPAPAEGGRFKRDWFRRHLSKPERLHVYMAVDWAVTPDGGDKTAIGVWGVDTHGGLYALDWWTGQVEPDASIEQFLSMAKRWKPLAAFMASGVLRRALSPAITRAMREQQAFVPISYLSEVADKVTRSTGFAARASAGLVSFPRGPAWAEEVISELCVFPGAKFDDSVDVCSLMGMALDAMVDAQRKREPASGPKPFTFDWATSGAAEEKPTPRTF